MIAVMILTVALSGQKDAATKVSVPFKKHENSMVVQVHINKKGPFAFILDTGAAMTVVSSRTAAEAGLRSDGEDVMLLGVGGQPVRGRLAQAREISLGGAKARRMDVVIYEIPQLAKAKISGLIGQDFLERFDLKFNNRSRVLTLSLPDAARPEVVEKKPLGLMEQMARKVYEDPVQPFGAFHEITSRAQLYYNLCATGAPPTDTDLEDFTALLYQNRKRMNQLYQHLLNLPFHELKPHWNANVQKFLYCWPDYREYIDLALALSEQLQSDVIHWEQAAAEIETLTGIAVRFACKPPLTAPAWLEDREAEH